MMLTIFTPTYNRAALLPRLYKSLCSQSVRDFEWLIVDDGSADNTSDLVADMLAESKLAIRYIKKANGGKHTAHNTALRHACGDWFMCLDSDDWLADGAIQRITAALSSLTETDCGLIAYKASADHKILSGAFSDHPVQHQTIYHHCNLTGGEFAFVFRSDILRRYPYPEIKNERFLGECIVYDQLDLAGYTISPLSQVLQICEYQPDGLSSSPYRLLLQNPTGYQIYHAQRMDLVTSFRQRARHAVCYQAFRKLSGNRSHRYNGRHRLLATAAWLPGQIGAKYYQKKGTC